MTQKEKNLLFIDFTRGHFGDHAHTEELKKIHKNYSNDLRNFRGCSACHKRRVNNQYRDLIVNKLLSSEPEDE
jgi:hypothetical protein